MDLLEKFLDSMRKRETVAETSLNMYKKDIEDFIVKLPCLEEQQKIADFLSSIDNKIDNLTSELENLKEFKKGLLQQMFV